MNVLLHKKKYLCADKMLGKHNTFFKKLRIFCDFLQCLEVHLLFMNKKQWKREAYTVLISNLLYNLQVYARKVF